MWPELAQPAGATSSPVTKTNIRVVHDAWTIASQAVVCTHERARDW